MERTTTSDSGNDDKKAAPLNMETLNLQQIVSDADKMFKLWKFKIN